MPRYTVIEDFKAGLDTRKSVLTSVPGSLVTLENAHVNQGGEIEKRQMFASDAVAFNVASFGLEAVAGGFVAFCGADPTGWTAPTGVTYQRLSHPASLYGGTVYAMTGVPFSCNYNGKAFVAATFADGKLFLYYDGKLIEQSWEGVVLAGRTSLTILGQDVARGLSREESDWAIGVNAGGAGWDYVYTPSGVYEKILADWVSISGYIASATQATDYAGVVGALPYATFLFSSIGTGTLFTITASRNADGSGTILLVDNKQVSSVVGTAVQSLSQLINTLSSATGYTAFPDPSNGSRLVIFGPADFGSSTAASVKIAWTIGLVTVVADDTFNGALYVSCPTVTGTVDFIQPTTAAGKAKPVIVGIHTPFTFLWAVISNPGNTAISNKAIANPTFSVIVAPGATMTSYWTLKVTDSGSPVTSITIHVMVQLTNTYNQFGG